MTKFTPRSCCLVPVAAGRMVVCLLAAMAFGCAGPGPGPDRSNPESPAKETGAAEPGGEELAGRWIFQDSGVMFGGDAVAIRLDAVEELQENRFRLTISPESTPINPSPWYGFEVRADEPRTVQLEFDYGSGQHRYWPKISRDRGKSWQPADPDATEEIDGRLHLKLALDEQSTLVFAQPPIGPRDIENWLSRHPAGDRLWMSKAGESVQGRDIPVVAFGSWKPGTPLLIIVARQHPPETTSALAMMKFVDTLLGDTSLARRFRRQVHTLVFPMANPDGVILGHWRGNARGVDLNRDWGSFRQPETRAIRNSIERTVRTGGTRPMLAIDFHSTHENVFYTITGDPALASGELLRSWLDELMKIEDGQLTDRSFAPVAPVFKNWIFKEYGVPAVTYEVSDATLPADIERIAVQAAEALMRLVAGESRLPGKKEPPPATTELMTH